jgi:hypothetical protein
MPLRDHFHGETELELPWPMMAQSWAISLVRWLNTTLPRERFHAVSEMRMGLQVEADVAEYLRGDFAPGQPGTNGSATALAELAPAPAAVLTVPAVFPDEIEIELRERRAGRPLVGIIELVSPGNKDRATACDAFVSKCVAYLRHGVGVVIVDVVTERHENLHNLLMERIGGANPELMPDVPTYVSGYRPVHRPATGANEIEVWPYAATVGAAVPAVPLGLRGGPVVLLDLEATYTAAIEATGL